MNGPLALALTITVGALVLLWVFSMGSSTLNAVVIGILIGYVLGLVMGWYAKSGWPKEDANG